MKKLFKVFALVLIGTLAMGLASCGTQGGGGTSLTLSPRTLSFTGAEGEKYVNVTGEEWTASVNQPWVHIDPATGSNGTITVSVDANATGAERYATLTVSNADGNQTVSIQQGFLGEVTVNPDALSFTASGATKTISVQSDTDWSVASNQTWLKVTKTNNTTLTAVADPNDGAERTAIITITNNAGSKTVTATQEENLGYELTIAAGGGYYFDYYNVGLGNYFTAIGNAMDSNGNFAGDGYVLSLDMLNELVYARGIISLPTGTYNYGDAPEPFTIIGPVSPIYRVEGGQGVEEINVASGTMVVTAEGADFLVEFDLIFDDGLNTPFKAYYRGPLDMEVNEADIMSYFYEDQDLGNVLMSGRYSYYPNAFGDYTVDGYVFTLMTESVYIDNESMIRGNGWFIGTQISAALGSGVNLPNGTYIIADNTAAGYVLAGYNNGSLVGAWVREVVDNAVTAVAPLKTGTITTTYSGGTYKFVFDAGDDAGNAITGILTGSLTAPASLSASDSIPDHKLAPAQEKANEWKNRPAKHSFK